MFFLGFSRVFGDVLVLRTSGVFFLILALLKSCF